MNRAENLCSSLESWVGSHPLIGDVVVVDWSSKKPIHEEPLPKRLMDEGKVKIVRVEGEKYFSLSKSYNLAFLNTAPIHKILLKLDADYRLINPSWMDYIQNQINCDGAPNDGELYWYFMTGHYMFSLSYTGFFLVNKRNFVFYNENMEGYGYDDVDMYARTKRAFPGLRENWFFNIKDYISHLPHSDEERCANYKEKDMKKTNVTNMKASSTFKISSYKTLVESDWLKIVERIIE